MDTKFREVRDPETHRLLGIYRQEDNIFETKQKGRVMQIRLPPDTPVEFIFSNS